jgi:transcription-repair coupling factor (superfamily II helicase)
MALAQRTLKRGEGTAVVPVRVGERATPDRLIASLLHIGYRTEPLAEQPGEVARRGGILDVFPASEDEPLRIEFLGDEIESIRRFDATTQRSTAQVNGAQIGPAREALDLPAAVEVLAKHLDLSTLNEEYRERFEEELGRLAAGDSIPEEGFYTPFLAHGSLFEHLPANALVVVDEPADLSASLEEHDEHIDSLRHDLESRGELPGGLPTARLSSGELRALIEPQPRRLQLSRWTLDAHEDNDGDSSAAEPIRLPFAPADGFGGRLRALTSDVEQARRKGRSIVIVSQQAQRLAEVLNEEGFATYVTLEAQSPQAGLVEVVQGSLPQGWRLGASEPPLSLITDAEVFGFV